MALKVTNVVKQVMHDYLYSIRAIDADTETPNMTTNLLINFKFGYCCARNLHLVAYHHLRLLENIIWLC